MRTSVNLDTKSLPKDEADKLHELVDKADFFNLPASFPAPKRGADYFQYRLMVEMDGRKHTVEVSDPAAPATLRPLLQFLIAYARK